jgi:hypothetical protein
MEKDTCRAFTAAGVPCRNRAKSGGFCGISAHQEQRLKGPGLPSGVAAVALAAPPDKIETRPALVAEAKSTAKQAAMQIASTDGKTQKHPPEARDTGGKRKVLVTIPGVGSAAILEAMV